MFEFIATKLLIKEEECEVGCEEGLQKLRELTEALPEAPNENEEILKKDGLPTIDNMHDFLDRMYEMFKDEYKKVIARVGLPNLISPEFLYKERKDGDDGINK